MKTKKYCKYYEEKNFDIEPAANAEGYFNGPENPCIKNNRYLKVKDKDICKTCKYKTGYGYVIDGRISDNPKPKKLGVINLYLNSDETGALKLPEHTAVIEIGNWVIQVTNKTFTEEQIKNMREMLGWEVTNL